MVISSFSYKLLERNTNSLVNIPSEILKHYKKKNNFTIHFTVFHDISTNVQSSIWSPCKSSQKKEEGKKEKFPILLCIGNKRKETKTRREYQVSGTYTFTTCFPPAFSSAFATYKYFLSKTRKRYKSSEIGWSN